MIQALIGSYRHSERARRISFDIDRPWSSQFSVYQVYFMLKQLFPNSEISVQKTRKGFHVKAIGREILSIPLHRRVELREKMGDDPNRVRWDQMKLRSGLEEYVDTLFSIKLHRDGQITVVEPVYIFAQPWVSRVPAKK